MITRAAQGAKPSANGKWIVAVACAGRAFNRNRVKRSAPELFPVTIMLKEPFIPAKKSGGLSM
jgi:hypothetical protein